MPPHARTDQLFVGREEAVEDDRADRFIEEWRHSEAEVSTDLERIEKYVILLRLL